MQEISAIKFSELSETAQHARKQKQSILGATGGEETSWWRRFFRISVVWNYLIAQRNKYRLQVKNKSQLTDLERAEHPSGQVSWS